jgi:Sortase domain
MLTFQSKRYGTLFLLSLIVLICFWLIRLSQPQEVGVITSEEVAASIAPTSTTLLPRSLPVSLSIPALALTTTFGSPLGVLPSGEVAVPKDPDVIGWYEHGPTPGEIGPAVVLGHVDSYLGPAVFFSLGQLKPGDLIEITRADGTIAQFQVSHLTRYEQSEFPTEAVYGNIPYAGLRLITCSGVYERGKERYTHNLVVYARLVE